VLSQAEIDAFAADGFAAAGSQPVLWEAFDQPGVALHDAFPLVPPLSPVELAMMF
jgi:hypothetical protein